MYKHNIRSLLKKKIGIDFVEQISLGEFSDVVLLKIPSEGIKAGKIVTGSQIKQQQMDVWPLLDHENVVRLEKTISMPDIDTSCFVMTRHSITLEQIVKRKEFQSHDSNVFNMKNWLLDVLSGTDYLHRNSLCHLNIEEENILISHNSRAKLGGFRLVTSSKQPVNRCGIAFPFYPPELCYSRGEDVLVDGIGVDLWSIGIMTLRLFTQNILEVRRGNNLRIWSSEVYKEIFNEIKYLDLHIYEAFLEMELTRSDLKRLKNFIRMFLALKPSERPSAELAMKHRFLNSGRFKPKTDAVWTKKASHAAIEMIVEEANTIENVRKRCEGRDPPGCANPPLKPHSKHQLIQISESNEGDQLAEVRFVKKEDISETIARDKNKDLLEKPLVVHSDEIISAWDGVKMPDGEDPRYFNISALKEYLTQEKIGRKITGGFYQGKSGIQVKKKPGIYSRTKNWFLKRFRSIKN